LKKVNTLLIYKPPQAAMDVLNTLYVNKQVQPTQLLTGRLLQDGKTKHGDL
jgi:hypothetical protein